MRHTLSVLSAVCLIALSQTAWSCHLDSDLQQRARMAAMALPATDRASAAAWLHTLPTPPASHTASTTQRNLPLSRPMAAVQRCVQQLGQTLTAHRLATRTVAGHWLQRTPVDIHMPPQLELDAAMVQRWSEAMAAHYHADPATNTA